MIIPIAGGPPTSRLKAFFDLEGFAFGLGWSPDGRSLLYIDKDRANIWSQPVDGSKPKRLTDFQGDELFSFAYSRDGKWVGSGRGRGKKGGVVITEAK